jgi:DNA-binding HxlR family transcriptional regulator
MERLSEIDRDVEITVLASGGPNAIAVTNGIVGDEWTLWIIQTALSAGISRYNEWLRAGPISSSVLTARLASLVEAGVFSRIAYTAHPPRFDYRLTQRGEQMWPILLTIWAWERRWVHDSGHRLPPVRHMNCGRIVDPIVTCDDCAAHSSVRDVTAGFGPAWTWSRSIPSSSTRRRAWNGARPRELMAQTMAVIGNRWSAALLISAFLGATRFGEFEQQMGAPPTIVADRLRTFCDLDFLAQSPHPDRQDWTTYHLTDKGRAFFPVVGVALEWGQRWFRSPEGRALEMTHNKCGADFHPVLVCDQCGDPLRAEELEMVRGARGSR